MSTLQQHTFAVNQKVQIQLRKQLPNTLILNTYYDEEKNKTSDKKRKQRDFGHFLIVQAKESSQENMNIHNTNAFHAPDECGHTASVPQESIGVQNVWVPSGM